MKNLRFLIWTLSILLVSIACQNATQHASESATSTASADTSAKAGMAAMPAMDTMMTYVCPMHADIKGKAGDKCSKCGMALVAASHPADTAHMHAH